MYVMSNNYKLDLNDLRTKLENADDVVIALLPFPSQKSSNKLMDEYYKIYSDKYTDIFDDYYIPEDTYWELPNWASYATSIAKRYDTNPRIWDASGVEYSKLMNDKVDIEGDVLLTSPLIQNYDLCKHIQNKDGITVIRGGVTTQEEYYEQDTPYFSFELERITDPDYSLLSEVYPNPPLLRIASTEGCVFECDFCTIQNKDAIKRDFDKVEKWLQQYKEHYPDTRIFYLDNKTFGQKPDSLPKLHDLFEKYYDDYQLIVQTNHIVVDDNLIEIMKKMNVKVVELGIETLDKERLIQTDKTVIKNIGYDSYIENLIDTLHDLNDNDMFVIGNLIAGLYDTYNPDPTLDFMNEYSDLVYLWNIYALAKYPEAGYEYESHGEIREDEGKELTELLSEGINLNKKR